MIVVYPSDKRFSIILEQDEEKLEFIFSQLSYKDKSLITSQTTTLKQGRVIIDNTLSCFLNLKYGLKDIKGLGDEEGNEYKLRWEEGAEGKVVEDACIDELMNTPISDQLIYMARNLMDGIPSEIVDPISGKPLEGVSIVVPKANTKKKS